MKTLKLVFASLFRNDAAMEGRFQKWYLAAIMFLLSIILATLPLFVTAAKANGSDFMDSTLYSFDAGIQRFSEALDDHNVDLIVAEDGEYRQLTNPGSTWDAAFADVEGAANFHYFSYKDHTDAVKLKVYYQGSAEDSTVSVFLTDKLATANSAEAINLEITSFVFFAKRVAYVYIYNPSAVAAGTAAGKDYVNSFQGDYMSLELGTNLRNTGLLDEFDNPIETPTDGDEYAAYQTKILANWERFFDESYRNSKMMLMWTTTSIMLGVNSLLGLFMAILIFIMTRGKNNPNRTMKFTEAMKITGWLLLSPAILTLIVGFIFPNYASMAFVLLVGLRMMWLSSKTLRPPLPPVPVVKK
ncbi:MAG: hypothetical protein WC399_04245 [Bacilli bacterium]|jgi:hypothetical protein